MISVASLDIRDDCGLVASGSSPCRCGGCVCVLFGLDSGREAGGVIQGRRICLTVETEVRPKGAVDGDWA